MAWRRLAALALLGRLREYAVGDPGHLGGNADSHGFADGCRSDPDAGRRTTCQGGCLRHDSPVLLDRSGGRDVACRPPDSGECGRHGKGCLESWHPLFSTSRTATTSKCPRRFGGCGTRAKPEFPDVWVRLDPDYQLWEAERLYQAYAQIRPSAAPFARIAAGISSSGKPTTPMPGGPSISFWSSSTIRSGLRSISRLRKTRRPGNTRLRRPVMSRPTSGTKR